MSMVSIRNLGFGGSGIPDALPKAVAELQGLKFLVVAGQSNGTVMVVPDMDAEDTIAAIINLTDNTNEDVGITTIKSRRASTLISCLTTAAEDDTIVVNGKTYTVKDVVVNPSYNAPPGVVPIEITLSGNDAEELADRLAKAIMSGDSSVTCTLELDSASPPAYTKVRVTVREPGVAGNSYTVSEVGTAVTTTGSFTGGLADAGAGFVSTDTQSGKTLLVIWYDKNP